MAGWFNRKMEEEKALMRSNEVALGSSYGQNMNMGAVSLNRGLLKRKTGWES